MNITKNQLTGTAMSQMTIMLAQRVDNLAEGSVNGLAGWLKEIDNLAESARLNDLLSNFELTNTTQLYKDGQVDGVVVPTVTAGTGYVTGDEIVIAGDGTSATAQVIASDGSGEVGTVVVTAGGSDYAITDRILIGGDGSGAEGQITSVDVAGAITGITMVSHGSGYTTTTVNVTAFDGGVSAGTGATFTTFLPVDGEIYDTVVTNGGENYTSATADFTGSGNGDAVGTASIGFSKEDLITAYEAL